MRSSSRVLNILLVVVLALSSIQLIAMLNLALTERNDLTQDYVATQAFMEGRSIYTSFTKAEWSGARLGMSWDLGNPLHETTWQNFHPPTTILLLFPLVMLPYPAAIIVWNLLCISLYIWLIWVVARELGLALSRRNWLIVWCLAAWWHPFLIHIGLSQLSLPITAGCVGCWLLLRRNRDIAAGIVLGLTTLIKLYPGLLLLSLIVLRRWRALAAALATISLGLLASWFVLGSADNLDYIQRVLPLNAQIFNNKPDNLSLMAVIRRLFDLNSIHPVVYVPGLVLPIQALVALLVLAVLIRQSMRMLQQERGLDGVFALFCLGMLLLSPITWVHAFVLAIPALWLVVRSLMQRMSFRRFVRFLLAFALLSLPAGALAQTGVSIDDAGWTWLAHIVLALPIAGSVLLGSLLVTSLDSATAPMPVSPIASSTSGLSASAEIST